LECHNQHDCNIGGRKTGMQLCFFDYVPATNFCEYDCLKQAAFCIWDEAVFRAVDVDWYYEGSYLDVHWFTRRILGTPVLCTTQFSGLISSLIPN